MHIACIFRTQRIVGNGPYYYYYRSSGAFTVLAGAVNVRDRRRATLDNNNEYDNNDLI